MKKFTTLNIILGVAIIIVGIATFFVWYQGEQEKRVFERVQIYIEGARFEEQTRVDQQKKFDDCLLKAETEYKRVWRLNSIEGTTPGGDKARKWNNADIADKSEDRYRMDKEFCLKLYKE